eukprot:9513446-Alexandrium_andersonii.AAC.1
MKSGSKHEYAFRNEFGRAEGDLIRVVLEPGGRPPVQQALVMLFPLADGVVGDAQRVPMRFGTSSGTRRGSEDE